MLTLKKLLQLQVLYYGIGVLFNMVSLNLISSGGAALTPNEPVMGCVVLSIYALFLIPGFLRKIKIYRVLMFVAIVLLGYGGVFNHLNMIRSTPELYHSVLAGVIGISINVFGLILNVLAMLGKFRV